MTDFQPVSIERGRELLKQNAPYVFQQVTLKYPIETTPKQVQLKAIDMPSPKVEEDDFIKGLEEDQRRKDSQIESC